MDTVRRILQKCNLQKYVATFESKGYDSANHLLEMGPDEFNQLATDCNILPGHLARLKRYISDVKNRNCPPAGPAPTGALESDDEPESDAAAASCVFVDSEGPEETISSSQESAAELSYKCVLKTEYEDWKEAKVASLAFSTAANCSAMQDVQKCGSRKKVFRCRTVLSKKRTAAEMEGEEAQECPHQLVWNRKKLQGNKWILNTDQSHLQHTPFCHSGQHVSRCELVNDPEFVKHVSIVQQCPADSAVKKSLGGKFCRMDGSVSSHTARRALNDINRYTDKDYDADWSKLAQWKREFEAKNPNSRCVIAKKTMPDGQNMFVMMLLLQLNWIKLLLGLGPNLVVMFVLSVLLILVLKAHTPRAPLKSHVNGPILRDRFWRFFVSLASALNIAFGCGMRFSAVDACYSRHSVFRDGYMHVLVTMDGNNHILPLAWAVCETESSDTYSWFAQQCHDAGIGRYLNAKSVVYSDRQKGVERFFGKFSAYHCHCFQHIIDNCRKHIKGSGTKFEDKTAWYMRNADSYRGFLHHLQAIQAVCPMAANYFRSKVNHQRTYQYAINQRNIATHGKKTSQSVESTNAVFVNARHHTPYRQSNIVLAWVGNQYDKHLKEINKWLEGQHILTPYAAKLFRIQVGP